MFLHQKKKICYLTLKWQEPILHTFCHYPRVFENRSSSLQASKPGQLCSCKKKGSPLMGKGSCPIAFLRLQLKIEL